jgi:serine protease
MFMWQRWIWMACLLIASGMSARGQESTPVQLMVQLHPGHAPERLLQDFPELDSISTVFTPFHIWRLHSTVVEGSAEMLLSQLQQHPAVAIAQIDHEVQLREFFPDDPFFNLQWNFYNDGSTGGVEDADVDMELAWDISTGGWTVDGDTIVVAVVDDGFFLGHNDLRYRKNWDEIPGNGLDDDNNGYIDDYDGWNSDEDSDNIPLSPHGTFITGIIGAKGDNFLGIAGMNWYMEVLPVSIGIGPIFESNVVEAYGYIWTERKLYNDTDGAEGSFIVATNASFGVDFAMPDDFPLWCAMYDSLGQQGIINVGATANTNINVDVAGDMPTTCPSDFLIAVNNLNKNDNKSNSAYGIENIDMGAPGALVYSTDIDNTYSYKSGTSFAAPHVAGAVALMLSSVCEGFIDDYREDPGAAALLLREFLFESVDPVEDLDTITVTGGRLNVYQAMLTLENYCSALDIPDGNATEFIAVYPNPATTHITIGPLPAQTKYFYSLADVLGRPVISGTLTQPTQSTGSISLETVPAGLYLLQISNPVGQLVWTEKIIVEQ